MGDLKFGIRSEVMMRDANLNVCRALQLEFGSAELSLCDEV